MSEPKIELIRMCAKPGPDRTKTYDNGETRTYRTFCWKNAEHEGPCEYMIDNPVREFRRSVD